MYGTYLFATIQYGDLDRKSDFTRVIDRFIDNPFSSRITNETIIGESKSDIFISARTFETWEKFETSRKQGITPKEIAVAPCPCE